MAHYERLLEDLVEGVLRTPGESAPVLRAEVEAIAASWGGVERGETPTLPEPLAAYIEKVACHAYRVTDEDIAALQASGYGEDAIFELTLAAAVGAGRARVERGLAALAAFEKAEGPGGAR